MTEDESYVRCREEPPGVPPRISTLLRLAGALDTGVTLTGGDVGLPLGRSRVPATEETVERGADECWCRPSTHGVGRLGVVTAEGVTILPVRKTLVDRPSPSGNPAPRPPTREAGPNGPLLKGRTARASARTDPAPRPVQGRASSTAR